VYERETKESVCERERAQEGGETLTQLAQFSLRAECVDLLAEIAIVVHIRAHTHIIIITIIIVIININNK
jgi:hypothetical protein